MADAANPAGAERSGLVSGLLRETPYGLLIILGLIGVGWTSLSRTPPTIYWVILTPIAALVCIAAGWRNFASNAERARLVASQLLHWAAFLGAMVFIRIYDIHGTLTSGATGLVLLTLLALGIFTAGLSLWSWKLCLTGAFLAVAPPVLAWVTQAALLIMLPVGVALIAIVVLNRWLRSGRGTGATEATGRQ
jgi:hypothetical protein